MIPVDILFSIIVYKNRTFSLPCSKRITINLKKLTFKYLDNSIIKRKTELVFVVKMGKLPSFRLIVKRLRTKRPNYQPIFSSPCSIASQIDMYGNPISQDKI